MAKRYTAKEMRIEAELFDARGGSAVIADMIRQAADMMDREEKKYEYTVEYVKRRPGKVDCKCVYFLSQLACSGIVRRAGSRGKKLPQLLADALEYMIAWWSAREQTEKESQAQSRGSCPSKADKTREPTPSSSGGSTSTRITQTTVESQRKTECPRQSIEEWEQGGNLPIVSHEAVAVRTANTGANGHGFADGVAHTIDGANGQAVGVDFYNGATTGESAKTLNCAATDKDHTGGVIVTNSNGGDVMPTVGADEYKMTQKQKDARGVRPPQEGAGS